MCAEKKLNFPLCTSLTLSRSLPLSLSLCVSLAHFASSQRRTASSRRKRPKARCWSWTASTLSQTTASGWLPSPELVAESRASRYFAKPPKMVRFAKSCLAKVHTAMNWQSEHGTGGQAGGRRPQYILMCMCGLYFVPYWS